MLVGSQSFETDVYEQKNENFYRLIFVPGRSAFHFNGKNRALVYRQIIHFRVAVFPVPGPQTALPERLCISGTNPCPPGSWPVNFAHILHQPYISNNTLPTEKDTSPRVNSSMDPAAMMLCCFFIV
jgi:hypothetical protein